MSMEYGDWTDIAPRLQLLNLENNTGERTLGQDVINGLGGRPKELPPKYFYDEYGSWLFDRICQVPEYYPTRTEDALLQRYARDIIATSKPDTIFELGSGASRKTVHLLNACEQESCFSIYQPLDVCGEILVDAGQRLTRNYGWLDVEALVGDYRAGLDFAAGLEGSGLYVFLGGSIGNFTHDQAVSFLTGVRRSMSDRDFMLLGADRVKSPNVLNAAYNDSRGYTEAFNLNILSVINRELGGQFNLEQFEHHAFFNVRPGNKASISNRWRCRWVSMKARLSVPKSVASSRLNPWRSWWGKRDSPLPGIINRKMAIFPCFYLHRLGNISKTFCSNILTCNLAGLCWHLVVRTNPWSANLTSRAL